MGKRSEELNRLLELVCEAVELPLAEVKGKCRKREISDARKIYFMLADELMPIHTHQDRANLMSRSHCTSIHNVMQGNNLIKTDRRFKKLFEKVAIRVEQAENPFNYMPQF